MVVSEVDPLSERMAAWCVAGVPGARRLVSAERLLGGLAAITHLITVEGERGASQWVLRSRLKPWPDRRPTEEIRRTVSTLALLSEHPGVLRAPTVAAHDATGEASGEPALLMSRLPGRADVSLENAARTVEQLARAMARFHAARLVCPPEHGRYAVDFARRAEPVPAGIVAPDWQRVFSRLETLNMAGAQLIHHDLHLGNVLFDGEALSGIVDWTEARTGPWQFDVGYCRVDLALLFGLDAADGFLAAYESERGERMSERPLWDLAGAAEAFPDPEKWRQGWLEFGRHDLSADSVRERLAVFVERALSQA